MFKWIQEERHEGRRNGEPWCSTLERAKPAKGIDRPWRLTVNRGWPAYPNRESVPRGEVNAKPAVFATFEDEATAKSRLCCRGQKREDKVSDAQNAAAGLVAADVEQPQPKFGLAEIDGKPCLGATGRRSSHGADDSGPNPQWHR